MSKSTILDGTNGRADPQDVTVQMIIRVPWHYRETLTKVARSRRQSLNRTLVNALVAAYPPEQ